MRHHRDRRRARQDQPDRERGHGGKLRAERADRREEGRDVHDRRHEHDEDDVALDLDLWQPRDESERESTDQEDDRVRHVDPPRDRHEDRDRDEEAEEQLGRKH